MLSLFFKNRFNFGYISGLGASIFSQAFFNVFTIHHLKFWLPCLLVVKTILFFSKEVAFTSFFFNLSGHVVSLFGVYLPPYLLIMCVSLFLFGVVVLFLYLLYSGVLKSKINFFLNNKKSTIFTFLGKFTGKTLISLIVVYLIFLFFGVDLTTQHISLFFSSLLHLVFAEILNGFVFVGWLDTVLGVDNTNPNNSPTPNPRPDGPSNTPVLPQDRNNSRPEETNTPVAPDVRLVPLSTEALANVAHILYVNSDDAPRVSAAWFGPADLSLLLDHMYQVNKPLYDRVCNGPLPRQGHHAPPNFQPLRNTVKFRAHFKPR